MIPTHKDLIINNDFPPLNGWVDLGLNGYILYGSNDKVLGVIKASTGVGILIKAKLLGKTKNMFIACNIPLHYTNYIPKWEQLMNDLLKTLFK